jgi:hypothetical protein
VNSEERYREPPPGLDVMKSRRVRGAEIIKQEEEKL